MFIIKIVSGIIGVIAAIVIAVMAIIWNNYLFLVMLLTAMEYILVQGVCYLFIYRDLTKVKPYGKSLFFWGNVTTILFVIVILCCAIDKFQHFSAALVALLTYSSALIMREVERTHQSRVGE